MPLMASLIRSVSETGSMYSLRARSSRTAESDAELVRAHLRCSRIPAGDRRKLLAALFPQLLANVVHRFPLPGGSIQSIGSGREAAMRHNFLRIL